MQIRVTKNTDKGWDFGIFTSNGTQIAGAMRLYANRRNAVAAAELLAKGKLKVVVE